MFAVHVVFTVDTLSMLRPTKIYDTMLYIAQCMCVIFFNLFLMFVVVFSVLIVSLQEKLKESEKSSKLFQSTSCFYYQYYCG